MTKPADQWRTETNTLIDHYKQTQDIRWLHQATEHYDRGKQAGITGYDPNQKQRKQLQKLLKNHRWS